MAGVWMAGVWNRRYEAVTVPPIPRTATLNTFTIIRKQYIANTKTTYSEEHSKQKSILKFVQSRVHVHSS